MARTFIEIRKSDLSGVEEDSVDGVTLAFDGRTVEVDLTAEERAELDDVLRPYLEAGRRVRSAAGASRKTRKRDATAIREWAQSQGYSVGDRGRIPAEVEAAYAAAHESR